MFACFCQVSLFPPPCPSHSAVTRWAPARSLFCSASSSCCPVLSVQTRGHPAVADHQDSCGAAFPLQCCCWLGAGRGCVVPGVTVGLCKPCEGRPGLPRAQRGCAADGTVVFPMSYCRGFASSALGRVSGDGSGDRAGVRLPGKAQHAKLGSAAGSRARCSGTAHPGGAVLVFMVMSNMSQLHPWTPRVQPQIRRGSAGRPQQGRVDHRGSPMKRNP